MLHARLRAAAGNRSGIPTDGLIVHYTGDNLSGTTLIDETGNSDLSLINGPIQEAGFDGQSIRYDGSNDYGLGSTTESFSAGATICARVRFNVDRVSNPIFSKRSNGNDIQFDTDGSGDLRVIFWGLNTVTSVFTGSFSTGIWYYLEASYNGSSNVKIRLDDTVQNFSRTGAIDDTSNGFRIAEDWNGNEAAINVDNFLLYNRGLDTDESDLVRSLI